MQSTASTFAEINQIKGCIDALDNRIQSLKTRYDRIIDAVDPALELAELRKDDSEIGKEFEDLKHTIQECKQYPHFEKIAETLQRRLGTVNRNYQVGSREYEKRKELRRTRHYEIVGGEVPTSHPEVENGPIFANHLLEIDKHSQSTHALSNVTYRHNEIQNIEATVCTLAGLIEEASELVYKQEEPIKASELKNEEVVEQVDKGNTEAIKAIRYTRSRNSKKWCALLIVGM
jgi:t-SNARE complex subunit (syntaxin)